MRAVLITKAFANTRGLASALKAFENEEVPVFDTIIYKREALAQSFGKIPEGQQLCGYQEVAQEIVEVLR